MRTFKISGDYEEVDEAFKSSEEVRDRERLQTVRMGMSGRYRVQEIATALGRSATVVLRWANAYRKGGVAGLLERKKPEGKKPSLGPEAVAEMTQGLKEGRWKRAKEVRVWLESDRGVKISLKGTYYWLGKLGGS